MEANMSDLRGSSTPEKVRFGSAGKIFGAVIVLVAVSAFGAYMYETAPAPKQHVSANQLPSMPQAPAQQQ